MLVELEVGSTTRSAGSLPNQSGAVPDSASPWTSRYDATHSRKGGTPEHNRKRLLKHCAASRTPLAFFSNRPYRGLLKARLPPGACSETRRRLRTSRGHSQSGTAEWVLNSWSPAAARNSNGPHVPRGSHTQQVETKQAGEGGASILPTASGSARGCRIVS